MKKKLVQQKKFLINVVPVNIFFSYYFFRFDLFISGIDSLFKKIGCDRRQIEHLLQSHEGVTEDNMLRYLGIIEERTNELLIAQATISAKVEHKLINI